MPTEDDIREIEEAASTLEGLFDTIAKQQTEQVALHKANAALWENLCDVHKQRANWYYGFIVEAKERIGSLIMNMDQKDVGHHDIVFHNKLAKIVEIVEAEKK